MKLRYILKKSLNIKNGYAIIILSTMILIACGYFSYALFTTYSESKGALNIVTGNLYSMIESSDLNSNKSITIAPGDTKIVTLKLSNVNSISAKVNLYYTATSNNIEIGYLSSGDAAPTNTGYVLNSYNESGSSKKIYVKISNNDEVDVTVTFGSDVGLSTATLAFPSGKNVLNRIEGTIKNNNILVAYTYQEDTAQEGFCITGEEKTCVVTNCIDDTTSDACPAGTVIKYHVNDTTDLFFNVLYDKEGVLTMQQRENTTAIVPWISKDDFIEAGGTEEEYGTNGNNTKGPITALKALEDATKDWDNVNELTYTPGETEFGTTYKSNNVACPNVEEGEVVTCSNGTNDYYSFGEQVAKARMITIQEASEMGCRMYNGNNSANMSCKKFMTNYMHESILNGGSNDISDQWIYWTLQATSNTSRAWSIHTYGVSFNNNVSATYGGVRAVVEVYKKL